MKTNPGSIPRVGRIDVAPTEIVPNPPQRFGHFFMSFNAQKLSFLTACRPFISVDGCHLKGPHGGVMLSAVTVDVNKGILPLAAMIVESETKYSWGEFMRFLHEYIGCHDERNMTFMSDRQKGVIDGIKTWFPAANHRYCALHIYSNFKGRYPGLHLKNTYWRAVEATEKHVFDNVMDEIKGTDVGVHVYLSEIPAHHQSMHRFDEQVKCDHITNNMSESFNASLGHYRAMPILSLCEHIRKMVMVRMNARYRVGTSMGHAVPDKVKKYIDDMWVNARRLRVMVADQEEYEVEDREIKFIVNLSKKICDCRYWSISGLPCKHALACIKYGRKDVFEYCHPYMKTDSYLKNYTPMIHPIPDQSKWEPIPHEKLDAPKKYNKRGRRAMNRRRGADEPAPKVVNVGRKTGTKRCLQCKQFRHNKRTCGGLPKKKQRGNNTNTQENQSTVGPVPEAVAGSSVNSQIPTISSSPRVCPGTQTSNSPIGTQTSNVPSAHDSSQPSQSKVNPTGGSGVNFQAGMVKGLLEDLPIMLRRQE